MSNQIPKTKHSAWLIVGIQQMMFVMDLRIFFLNKNKFVK